MICSSLVSRLFKFGNEGRGTIEFKGNMLFTHFSEINSPKIGSPTDMGGQLDIPVVAHPDISSHDDFPNESINSGKQ